MANPYFDRLAALGPQGILAQPSTITNPIQNAMSPEAQQALFAAAAEQRTKQKALEQTLMRAQALKEQPGGGYAQGAGPLGARQGVGPMGWATTIGDVVAGVISRSKQKKASEASIAALGATSPAEQRLAEQLQMTAPGGLFQMKYQTPQLNYVPQGSVLGLGNE